MFQKLKTEIWISGYLKYLNSICVPAYIVKKGDKVSGSIFIKVINNDNYSNVFGRVFLNNSMQWTLIAEGDEKQISEFVGKQMENDNDLWLIEIEDNNLRNFLEKF